MKDKVYAKSIEKSINTFGQTLLLIACEEMGELMQAISKMERVTDTGSKKELRRLKDHIIEEMVDVSIVLDELKVYYNIGDDEIKKMKAEKIARLKKRAKDM
jgi:NTP pyrophosphatase (non-canonical NTP hydrolase)